MSVRQPENSWQGMIRIMIRIKKVDYNPNNAFSGITVIPQEWAGRFYKTFSTLLIHQYFCTCRAISLVKSESVSSLAPKITQESYLLTT